MNHYAQTVFNAVQAKTRQEPSRLWFEVMMQAFRDILEGDLEARAWLYSDDFEACCKRAGAQNLEGIRTLIEQALRSPLPATQNAG